MVVQKDNEGRDKRAIKYKISKVIIFICIIVLIVSLYYLLRDLIEYKKCDTSNIKLIENVIIEEKEEKKLEIDWEQLEKTNSDIIGWIKIDDTNINYPILKDNDKLKYLRHSFDGSYNRNGSIFTVNSNPFEDNVTVIYGHNMKSGLMFSELGKYMNEAFFNSHSSYEIYTKTQNYKATIFSCYSTGIKNEENNIKSLNFEDELEYYKKMNVYPMKNIDKIKKIVKLSTCSYLNNHTTPTDQRYYVVASIEKT